MDATRIKREEDRITRLEDAEVSFIFPWKTGLLMPMNSETLESSGSFHYPSVFFHNGYAVYEQH